MSLPTVKLTLPEWTSLITALVLEIGETNARQIMVNALGEARATKLIEDRAGPALSKQDNHALVRELYTFIPSATRADKITWLIAKGRTAFATDARFAEVVAFVRDRVEAFEAAGGTLETNVDPVTPPAPPPPPESDIPAGTQFLHTNVSGWAVTAKLEASVSGGQIRMPYDKARAWPAVDGCNANPWAIIQIGGQWYAATFEYFKHGQTSKPVGVLDRSGGKGDHFKRPPLSSWTPKHGERFGLMVSGLARASARNVKERSQVVMVVWP